MYHPIFRGRKEKKEKFLTIFFRNFSVFIFSPASAKTFTIRHLRGSSCNYSDIFAFLHGRSSRENEKKRKEKKREKENRENYRCSQREVSLQTLQQILRIQFFASNFRLRGYVNCLCREPVHPD